MWPLLPVIILSPQNSGRLMATRRRINLISHLVLNSGAFLNRPTTHRTQVRFTVGLEREHFVLLALRPLRTHTLPTKKPPVRDA